MALTKVTGGTISTTGNYHTNNINSSGIITATKFVGPFEGDVSGIATGANKIKTVDESSDTTCFPLFVNNTTDVYQPAKLGSNLTFNSSTGDLGATKVTANFAGNITGTGATFTTGTFTGNLDVGGTLNYTHVTDVYSVGVATFANNVQVGAGISVVGVSTFQGDIDANADIELAGNLAVTGVSTFTGNVDTRGDILLSGATAGVSSATWDASANTLIFNDDVKAKWGNGGDLQISHSAAGSGSNTIDSSAGYLYINTDALRLNSKTSAWNYLRADKSDGVLKLYKSNSEKLATSDTGISVTGEVAATQDYPNYRPTLDFNFASVKKLDPRITYTRSGPASYVDEFGIVKLVGDNAPRFDHDPVTKECKGLLIENQGTNQMINSSNITAATVYNGTITGNATTAPDNTTDADQFACSSTNAMHRVDLPFTSAQITNSNTYTFSVFVKANGYDKLHVRYGGYGGDDHGLGYDLNDGTTFAGKFDGTGALGAVTSSSMVAYPNDWYRCSFTFTTASNATSGTSSIYYYVSNSESTTNFAGDGSSGMYFWGSQFEVATTLMSYIPTNGTTATRGPALAYIDGQDFTDAYSTSEGSFVVRASVEDLSTSNQSVFGVEYSASRSAWINTVGYRVGGNSSGRAGAWYVYNGGGTQGYLNGDSSGAITAGTSFAAAYAYKYNDFALSCNGGTVITDSTGPTVDAGNFNRFIFGSYHYDAFANGHIQRATYYPKRLTNNQLLTLTS